VAEKKSITEDEALRLAEKAIEGKVQREPGAPVEVTYSRGAYTVTFVHINPPNTLGADYDAQITIDASTGEVLDFKVGP
jgi:uncharacterized membrane protein YkoI